MTQYLLGRHVRAYLYRRDQYDRVVARVVVRRFWFFKRDVGLEMIKRGLATCYEAKTGAEFGGRETQYRIAEARAKSRKKGLWSGNLGRDGVAAPGGDFETPREYKTRMAALDAANGVVAASASSSPKDTTTTATKSTSTFTSTSSSILASTSSASSASSAPTNSSTKITTPSAVSSSSSSSPAASPAKPTATTTPTSTPSPSAAATRPNPGVGTGKDSSSSGKSPLPNKK